jgi:hypothetical protein
MTMERRNICAKMDFANGVAGRETAWKAATVDRCNSDPGACKRAKWLETPAAIGAVGTGSWID